MCVCKCQHYCKTKLGHRQLYWIWDRQHNQYMPFTKQRVQYDEDAQLNRVESCWTWGSDQTFAVHDNDMYTDIELFMQGINPYAGKDLR